MASRQCPDVKLVVVQNALVWPDQNWQLLIGSQLQQLSDIGLAECASIHVVLSAPVTANNYTYSQLEDMLAEGKLISNGICCHCFRTANWVHA